MDFPGGSDSKEFACNAGDLPWRREWQPTLVFLPGEFHGQRSLADHSPSDRKESDTTGQLTLSLSHCIRCSIIVVIDSYE